MKAAGNRVSGCGGPTLSEPPPLRILSPSPAGGSTGLAGNGNSREKFFNVLRHAESQREGFPVEDYRRTAQSGSYPAGRATLGPASWVSQDVLSTRVLHVASWRRASLLVIAW